MKKSISFLVMGLFFLSLASCGPRQDKPAESRKGSSSASQKGRQVFDRHCGQCHPDGKAGFGPALKGKPLPSELTKDKIRQGIGVMPSFPEKLLPDEELDNLMEYIKGLGEHG